MAVIQQHQQRQINHHSNSSRQWSITTLLSRLFLLISCLSFPVTVILVNVVEHTSTTSVDSRGVIGNNGPGGHPYNYLKSQQQQLGLMNKKKNLHNNKNNNKRKKAGLNNKNNNNRDDKSSSSTVMDESILYHDKDRLIETLKSQNNINFSDISKDTWLQIPTWTQITELYGTKPIVVGLDQCQTFRDAVPEEHRIIAPAGLFNTGTNLIAQLLEHNCYFPKRLRLYGRHGKNARPGVAWQTPWGKHSPPEFRNKTVEDPMFRNMNKDYVLPIVAIREPYEWMISTCHNNYVLRWPHRTRCPNLIHPNGTLIEVYNQYFHGAIRRYHKSLAHFWNDWNRQYVNAGMNNNNDDNNNDDKFPRLMIRHKDLIFYPKETIELVCECAGAQLINESNFTYIIESAKKNRKGLKPFDGLVGNWIKYGKQFNMDQYSKEDRKVAEETLDQSIMDMFGFKW